MNLRRLRVGEWVAAASGVVLIVSLFLPWYSHPGEAAFTAWEVFGIKDILWALIGAFAIFLLVVTAAEAAPAVPIATSAMTTIAGLVAVVSVAHRLIDRPGLGDLDGAGGWLGLAGAIGITVGAAVAMRDERLSKPGRPTDASGAPSDLPPEIETIPPPRP